MKNIYSFKPLTESDLDLLCAWLEKPHVKEWWNDQLTHSEIKKKYRERIGDTVVLPFIVYLNEKPIGFIQYYHADKVGEGWWPDEVEGTVGIDQFIGEEDFVNKGFGTQMIKAFVQQLLSKPHIKKVIVDVDPQNQRAVRCYEKVGFKFLKKMLTPDGWANVLEFKNN